MCLLLPHSFPLRHPNPKPSECSKFERFIPQTLSGNLRERFPLLVSNRALVSNRNGEDPIDDAIREKKQQEELTTQLFKLSDEQTQMGILQLKGTPSEETEMN